jgi:predicted DsbA family dithiol-disulfide isomerase
LAPVKHARQPGLTGIPFTVLAGKQAIAGVVSAGGFRRAIEAALATEGND